MAPGSTTTSTKGAGYEDRFVWKRNGVEISGQTGPDYTLDAPGLGRNVSCAVAATNPVGTSGYVDSPNVFVPLPSGSSAGKLDKVYRDNRNDPITMMATSDEYRDKAAALFKRLQDQQLAALKQSCDTPSARKQEFQPQPPPAFSTPGIFVPPQAPALFPQQQCWVVNHLANPPFLLYTSIGYFFCPAGGPIGFGLLYSCNPLGLTVAPVNPATADALPAAESDELAAVTPDEVLWDVDNDGRTDIACPGESPAVRGNFDIGRYNPHAVIVTKSSAQTGLFYNLTTEYDFPDKKAVTEGGVVRKGAKRAPLQPLWCRNSITPPADPQLAPCTSVGYVGRVAIKGNLCPMNVRSITDDALKGLPDELQTVIRSAADVINAQEREREKAQPGYSEGERRASLMARALPSAGDLSVAATAINTAASIAGLPAAQGAAANGGSQVEQKLDKVFGKGGEVDKKVPGFKPLNAQFALDQIYTAAGQLSVNGVQIDPANTKVPTLIVPSDAGQAIPGVHEMTILSQKAHEFMKSPVDAARQAAEIPINEGKKRVEHEVTDQANKATQYLSDKIDLSRLGDKLDLGPFKLTGSSAKVEMNNDGTATLHAVAKLPGLTNAVAPPSAPDAKAGDPISIGVDLLGDLTGRIKLQGLHLKVPKAYLVGIQLSDLDLQYNDKGLDVSGKITFPLCGQPGHRDQPLPARVRRRVPRHQRRLPGRHRAGHPGRAGRLPDQDRRRVQRQALRDQGAGRGRGGPAVGGRRLPDGRHRRGRHLPLEPGAAVHAGPRDGRDRLHPAGQPGLLRRRHRLDQGPRRLAPRHPADQPQRERQRRVRDQPEQRLADGRPGRREVRLLPDQEDRPQGRPVQPRHRGVRVDHDRAADPAGLHPGRRGRDQVPGWRPAAQLRRAAGQPARLHRMRPGEVRAAARRPDRPRLHRAADLHDGQGRPVAVHRGRGGVPEASSSPGRTASATTSRRPTAARRSRTRSGRASTRRTAPS